MMRNGGGELCCQSHYPLAWMVFRLVGKFPWYKVHPRSVVCHTSREPLRGWQDRCLLPTLLLQCLHLYHRQDKQQELEINHLPGQASRHHIPLTRLAYQIISRLNRITLEGIAIITTNIVNTMRIKTRMVQAPPQKEPPEVSQR